MAFPGAIEVEAGRQAAAMYGGQGGTANPLAPMQTMVETMRGLTDIRQRNAQYQAQLELGELIRRAPDPQTALAWMSQHPALMFVPEAGTRYAQMQREMVLTAGQRDEQYDNAMSRIAKYSSNLYALADSGSDDELTAMGGNVLQRALAGVNDPVTRQRVAGGYADYMQAIMHGAVNADGTIDRAKLKHNIEGAMFSYMDPGAFQAMRGGVFTQPGGVPLPGLGGGYPPGVSPLGQGGPDTALPPPAEQAPLPTAPLTPVEAQPLPAQPSGAAASAQGDGGAAPPPAGAGGGGDTLTPASTPSGAPPPSAYGPGGAPLPPAAPAAPATGGAGPAPTAPAAPAAIASSAANAAQATAQRAARSAQLRQAGFGGLAYDNKPLFTRQDFANMRRQQLGAGGEPIWAPGAQKLSDNFTDDNGETGAYNDATRALNNLTILEGEVDALGRKPGALMGAAGAGERLELAKGLNLLATAFGVPAPFDKPELATAENIQKMGNQLAMQLGASMWGHQRVANATVQFESASVPGLERTYLGNKIMIENLRAVAQRTIDQYEFKDHWRMLSNGNLDHAQVAFNTAHPSYLYAQGVLNKFGVPQGGFTATPEGLRRLKQAVLDGRITQEDAETIRKNVGMDLR
jgi:hypothetical protein